MAKAFPPDDLAARCGPIELIVTDVDGVLTDGTIWRFPAPHGVQGNPKGGADSMLDAGGYWHLKGEETMQLLFAYGHSIAGLTENYAYLGLYWTWGKDDKKSDGKDPGEQKALLRKAMYSGHTISAF